MTLMTLIFSIASFEIDTPQLALKIHGSCPAQRLTWLRRPLSQTSSLTCLGTHRSGAWARATASRAARRRSEVLAMNHQGWATTRQVLPSQSTTPTPPPGTPTAA
jgi:hypothetical protein